MAGQGLYCAYVCCVQDLISPVNLARSLALLQTHFPGCDPLELLTRDPEILKNLGESSVQGESSQLVCSSVPRELLDHLHICQQLRAPMSFLCADSAEYGEYLGSF